MTQYIDFYGLTKLQRTTFNVIDDWSRKNTTPIAHKEILKQMKAKGVQHDSIINSIRALVKKGYIRKAIIISNSTFYVRLRTN